MGRETAIEWTDSTWNPVSGCVKVSPGCANCYAERYAKRRLGGVRWAPWSAKYAPRNVVLKLDRLMDPFRWYEPRKVFTCSMSDLFQDAVSDSYIVSVFAVMAAAWWHTFQVLTKRPERMARFMESKENAVLEATKLTRLMVTESSRRSRTKVGQGFFRWPLPNVWLGTSVEDQPRADERLRHLCQIRGALLFVSAEPLLEAVELGHFLRDYPLASRTTSDWKSAPAIHWVIVGGESGPNARPMNPEWATKIRDDCSRARVPFFFKQQGEWAICDWVTSFGKCAKGHKTTIVDSEKDCGYYCDEAVGHVDHGGYVMCRVGKKAAGRLLEGRSWDEVPDVGYPFGSMFRRREAKER